MGNVNAYISNFAIFNSVKNVSDLYVDGQTPIDVSSFSGLIAYYKFDEGSGETALDSSGKNRTANLINTPAWSTIVP